MLTAAAVTPQTKDGVLHLRESKFIVNEIHLPFIQNSQ